jgi:hypothetical protein
MKDNYTAVLKKSGEWWIGWIEAVPGVNCQEATREQLVESLRITLREISFAIFEPRDVHFFVRAGVTRGGTTLRKTSARRFRGTMRDDGLARKICKDLGIPPVK